jgi:hypothetical protein
MGYHYAIAGFALFVTGIATTTLRQSGKPKVFGRLLVLGGLGILGVWLTLTLTSRP